MKRRMLSLYHTCKCRKKQRTKIVLLMAYVRHFARSHHRHVIEGPEDVEVDFFHCINSRILFTKMWSCSSKARAKTESVNFHEKQTGKKEGRNFCLCKGEYRITSGCRNGFAQVIKLADSVDQRISRTVDEDFVNLQKTKRFLCSWVFKKTKKNHHLFYIYMLNK